MTTPGLRVVDLTPAHAAAMTGPTGWAYAPPYDVYDLVGADPADLLDPAAGFHAVVVDGPHGEELVGFRSFGPDGQVPGWAYDDSPPGVLDTGGGLRPDLVGQGRGLGRAAIAAGLAFGRERLAPAAFRVTVAAFNTRALRTVGSLGFERVDEFAAARDGRVFVVLVRREG